MLLENKTAFITGCNRGLGRAIMEKFAREGCRKIYAHARTRTDAFESELQKTAERYSLSIRPVYFDVTDTAAMKGALRDIRAQKEEPINVLVNCAGIAHGGYLQMTPMEDIKRVFEVNTFAPLALTQAVSGQMRRTGG